MVEATLELSPFCCFELQQYAKDCKNLTLEYTEFSSDYWHSDTETSVDITPEKAREVIAFMERYIGPELQEASPVAGPPASTLRVREIKKWYEDHVKPVFAEGAYSTNVAWLIDALDSANRRAQYWKDEHLAGNVEIEKLKNQLNEVSI